MRKRIVTFLLFFALAMTLLIPSGLVSAITVDSEKTTPVISKVEISTDNAKSGESIVVTVYASDPNAIIQEETSEVQLQLKDEYNYDVRYYKDAGLVKKEEGIYEAVFDVTDEWKSGEYVIQYIHIDRWGSNSKYYFSHDEDSIIPDTTISIETEETAIPKITKVEMDAQTVKPGDSFSVTLSITNPEKVKSGYVEIQQTDRMAGHGANLENKGNGVFVATFAVSESWASADYIVYRVIFYDDDINDGYIEYCRFYTLNFSSFDNVIPYEVVSVVNGDDDVYGPQLIKVDAKSESVSRGDTFTITVTANDPSGLDATKSIAYVSYENRDESGYARNYSASFEDIGNNQLEATFTVQENWIIGAYQLREILLADKAGNERRYIVLDNENDNNIIPYAIYTVNEKENDDTADPEEEEDSPTEPSKPAETITPSESPKPSEPVNPSESPKPSETVTPSQSPFHEPIVFDDVKEGLWYSDAVSYCAEQGYMEGIGDSKFDPEATITRGAIAQILYAQSGKPEVRDSSDFTDVKEGKWYADAIAWAAEEGIVAGYKDGTFRPEDPITRQQMVAILYKYAELNGYDTAANGDLSQFKDADKLALYAVTPMKWAVGHKVISGTNIGLEPNATATRAQVAVILQAFDKNVK